MREKTDEEVARSVAVQIFGEWAQDHEYGDRKDRARAKGQHNAKLYATTELVLRHLRQKELDTAKEIIKSLENCQLGIDCGEVKLSKITSDKVLGTYWALGTHKQWVEIRVTPSGRIIVFDVQKGKHPYFTKETKEEESNGTE